MGQKEMMKFEKAIIILLISYIIGILGGYT